MFHEQSDDPAAGRAFEQLAALTGGACFDFDQRSADRLRELLGAIAVYATGGVEALTVYGANKGSEILRLTALLQDGGRP